MDSLAKTRIIETVCGLSLRQDMKSGELENSVCQESPQWLTQLSEQITEEQQQAIQIEEHRVSAKLEKYKIKSGRLLQIEQSRLATSLSKTRWKTLQTVILSVTALLATYEISLMGETTIITLFVGCFLFLCLKVDNLFQIG